MIKIILTFFSAILIPATFVFADTIPKKVHFIWIGNNIPSEYFHHIKSISARNFPHYQVNLWVDRKLDVEKFLEKDDSGRFPLIVREISEITDFMPKLMRSYFEREKHGIFPNFAAAADVLRITILYKEGGFYLDTDIIPSSISRTCFNKLGLDPLYPIDKLEVKLLQEQPTNKKVNPTFTEINTQCGLLVNLLKKDDDNGNYFNNDMLAAPPHSAIVGKIMRIIEKNLEEAEKSNFLELWITKRLSCLPHQSIRTCPRFTLTLKLAGPDVIRDVIQNQINVLNLKSGWFFIQKKHLKRPLLKNNRCVSLAFDFDFEAGNLNYLSEKNEVFNESSEFEEGLKNCEDAYKKFLFPYEYLIDQNDLTWFQPKSLKELHAVDDNQITPKPIKWDEETYDTYIETLLLKNNLNDTIDYSNER